MPPITRAVATVMLVCVLAAACGTDGSADSESVGLRPAVENPATLPAMYVPSDQYRAHGGKVSTDPALCGLGATTCVPAGVYRQQTADGDWCSWHHYPAEYYQRLEAGEGGAAVARLVSASFKDADGVMITLRDGDELSYGPTTGAIRYSEGLPNTEGWHGDGKQRGCAEWVQVGTLQDAVPSPRPTTEECEQLVAEGEAAYSRVSDIVDFHQANLDEIEASIRAALAAGTSEMADPAIVEGARNALVEVMAAMQEAQPKVHRAEYCYSFLGDEQGASEMSRLASGYIYAWADIKQQCPTTFAPIGIDCARLG